MFINREAASLAAQRLAEISVGFGRLVGRDAGFVILFGIAIIICDIGAASASAGEIAGGGGRFLGGCALPIEIMIERNPPHRHVPGEGRAVARWYK